MDVKNSMSDFQFIGNTIKKLELYNNYISLNDVKELNKCINVDYKIDEIDDDADEKYVYGTLTLFIDVDVSEGLQLNMDIQGCFKASQETSKEEFNKMLSINGCAALFSIARSIIVSVTSQSLVQGSILLPMVNIFNLRKEKLELEKE